MDHQQSRQGRCSAVAISRECQHPAKPQAHPEGRADCHQHPEGESPPIAVLGSPISTPQLASRSTGLTRVLRRCLLPPCAEMEELPPAFLQSLPWSSGLPSSFPGSWWSCQAAQCIVGASSVSPACSAHPPHRASPPSPAPPPPCVSPAALLVQTFLFWLCCPSMLQLSFLQSLGLRGSLPFHLSPAGPCRQRPCGMTLAADQLCFCGWSFIAAL